MSVTSLKIARHHVKDAYITHSFLVHHQGDGGQWNHTAKYTGLLQTKQQRDLLGSTHLNIMSGSSNIANPNMLIISNSFNHASDYRPPAQSQGQR
jgi:hypothetical protein